MSCSKKNLAPIWPQICIGLLFALALYPTVAESQTNVAKGARYYLVSGAPLDSDNQRLQIPNRPNTEKWETLRIFGGEFHYWQRTSYSTHLMLTGYSTYDSQNRPTAQPAVNIPVSAGSEITYSHDGATTRSGLIYDASEHFFKGTPTTAGEYHLKYEVEAVMQACIVASIGSRTCLYNTVRTQWIVDDLTHTFTLAVLRNLPTTATPDDGHLVPYGFVTTEGVHKGDNAFLRIAPATLPSGRIGDLSLGHRITSTCHISLPPAPARPCRSTYVVSAPNIAAIGTTVTGITLPAGLKAVRGLAYPQQEFRLSGGANYPGYYIINYTPVYSTFFQGVVVAGGADGAPESIKLDIRQNSVPSLASSLPASFEQYGAVTTHTLPRIVGGNGALTEQLTASFSPPSSSTSQPLSVHPTTGQIYYDTPPPEPGDTDTSDNGIRIQTGLTFTSGEALLGGATLSSTAEALAGTYRFTYKISDGDSLVGASDEYEGSFVLTVYDYTFATGSATAPDLGTIVLVRNVALQEKLTLTRITAPANTQSNETLTFNSFQNPDGTTRTPSIGSDGILRVGGTYTGLKYVRGNAGTASHIEGTPRVLGTYSLTQTLAPVAQFTRAYGIRLQVLATPPPPPPPPPDTTSVGEGEKYELLSGAALDPNKRRLQVPAVELPASTETWTAISQVWNAKVSWQRTSYTSALYLTGHASYDSQNRATEQPAVNILVPPGDTIRYFYAGTSTNSGVTYGYEHFFTGTPASTGEYHLEHRVNKIVQSCVVSYSGYRTCESADSETITQDNGRSVAFTIAVLVNQPTATVSDDGSATPYTYVTSAPLQKDGNLHLGSSFLKITPATSLNGNIGNATFGHLLTTTCHVSSPPAAECPAANLISAPDIVLSSVTVSGITLPAGLQVVRGGIGSEQEFRVSGAVRYPGYYTITYLPVYFTDFQGTVVAGAGNSLKEPIRLDVEQNTSPALASAFPNVVTRYRAADTYAFPAITGGNGTLTEQLTGSFTPSASNTTYPLTVDPATRQVHYSDSGVRVNTGLTFTPGRVTGGIPTLSNTANSSGGTYSFIYKISDSDRLVGTLDEYTGGFTLALYNYAFATGNATIPNFGPIVLVNNVALIADLTLSRVTVPANADPKETFTFNSFHRHDGTERPSNLAADGTLMVDDVSTGLIYVPGGAGTVGYIKGTPRVSGTYSLTQTLTPIPVISNTYDITLQVVTKNAFYIPDPRNEERRLKQDITIVAPRLADPDAVVYTYDVTDFSGHYLGVNKPTNGNGAIGHRFFTCYAPSKGAQSNCPASGVNLPPALVKRGNQILPNQMGLHTSDDGRHLYMAGGIREFGYYRTHIYFFDQPIPNYRAVQPAATNSFSRDIFSHLNVIPNEVPIMDSSVQNLHYHRGANYTLNLPEVSGGNFQLGDLLRGQYDPDGSGPQTAAALATLSASGSILLPDGSPSGLTYTSFADSSNGRASISGVPLQSGSFSLIYEAIDSDELGYADPNYAGHCTGTDSVSGYPTPSGCDSVRKPLNITVGGHAVPALLAATPPIDGQAFEFVTGSFIGDSLIMPLGSEGQGTLTYSLEGTVLIDDADFTFTSIKEQSAAGPIRLDDGSATGLYFTPQAGTSSAGSINGTPTVKGIYSLVYTVADSDSETTVCTEINPVPFCDTDSARFTVLVAENIRPTLTNPASTSFTGNRYRAITPITLPTAGAGNGSLIDSLSGSFDGVGTALDGSISLAADNKILLRGGTDSGLTFTARGDSGAATISGKPSQLGTFTLTYSVRDDDNNVQASDTASTSLTLAITPAALQLGGGIADSTTVDLAKDSPLTTSITLPQVTGGASAAANLSRTLTAQQTADSNGAIASPQAPATVASAAEAIPGLTYTALSTSGATTTPGTLAGTPDTSGTWLLAYSIVDNNGTTGAGNAVDDLSASINFTLKVLDNDAPSLQTLSNYSFSYTVADPVGADADTPFALPAISGGNGAVSDSVSTSCAPISGSGSCAAAATSGTAGQPGSLPAGLTFTAADASAGTAASLSGAFTGYGATYTLIYSATDTPQILTSTYQTVANTANTVTATFTFVVAQGNNTPTFSAQTPASPKLLEKLPGDNADSTPDTLDDPRLLATLTFADADAADTLSYSIAGVTPATLSTGDFSVTAKTGNSFQVELSFIGDASAIDHDDVQSFTVTVRADDSGVGGQIDQPVEVTVLDNTAPTVSVAVTGTPSLLPGSPLALTASVSDANTGDGDILSYAWTVAAATAAPGVTGATAAIGDLSLTPTDDQTGVSLNVPVKPSGTTYTIQFAVTDRAPQTTTATYSLVVANAPIAFSYSGSPSGTPPTYSVANGIVATSGDDTDLIATITASDPNDPSGASLQYSGTVSVSGTDTVLGLSSRNSTDISAIFGFAASGADLGELSVISSTPLTAAATYQLRLTVAKTKGDGSKATATTDFDVQVPNPNAAMLTTAIANIASLPRSTASTPSTRAIDLYDHFSPTAGLTFKATSSNTKVLTLSESGGVLTLTATRAGGTSSVEVSASNASTSSTNPPTTTFSVAVTPSNNPILPAAQITNIEALTKGMGTGAGLVLDLDTYFSDPDTALHGDTLSYELLDAAGNPQSSITHRQTIDGTATDVLTVSLSGASLTLSPLAKSNADLSVRVRATDNGGNSFVGTFVATVLGRPAFSAATYSANLAENTSGSGTALLLTELTVNGGTGAKTYRLLSVNGQTSGADYGKFAVAAKLDASNNPIDTAAVVTYSGTGEDYEARKALSTPNEPTFVLVIGVSDSNNLAALANTTLTVTLTDRNEAPTASAACASCTVPGTTVQLRASASDPDVGDRLTYSWTLTAASGTGAAVGDIDLDTATAGVQNSVSTQNPSITLPNKPAGSAYSFSLQVSDNNPSPLTASATLTLTLAEADARFVQIGSGDTRTVLGSSLALTTDFGVSTGHLLATIQAEDPNGGSLTYSLSGTHASNFAFDSNTGSASYGQLTVVSSAGLSDGDYSLTLTAGKTQADGTADSTSLNITTTVSRAGPVTLTSPIAKQTIARTAGSASPLTLSNLGQHFTPSINLTFSTPTSSNTAVAAVALVNGDELRLTPTGAGGTTTITYGAKNALQMVAQTGTFTLEVTPSNAPVFTAGNIATLAAIDLTPSGVALKLGDYFSDPDSAVHGDTLAYSLRDGDGNSQSSITYRQTIGGTATDVLTVTLSGSDLTLTPKGVPTVAAIPLTLRATDNGGNSQSGTFNASVSNAAPTAVGSIAAIALMRGGSHSLSNLAQYFADDQGTGGLTYSYTPDSGGVLTGTLSSAGLSLQAASNAPPATITATLTASDSASQSATQTITVHVANPVPTFGTASVADTTYIQGLAAGVSGNAAALSLPRVSTGTGAPPLAYSLSGSKLSGADLGSSQVGGNTQQHPPGMTLSLNASSDTAAATLSGTPTQIGAYSMVWSVRDGNGASASLSAPFQITVVADAQPSLPSGLTALACTYRQGIDYSPGTGCPAHATYANALPQASGGNGALTYALAPVPAGMTFDASTRTLSGTPSTAAVYRAQYSASDGDGDTATLPLTLTVDGTPLLPSPGDLVLTRNKPLTGADALTLPRASGGSGTPTYALTATPGGGLPAGLSFDPGTSTLSGTPTHSGDYNMVYSATDADGDTTTARFRIKVDGTPEFAANIPTLYDLSGGRQQVLPAVIVGSGNGTIRYSVAPAAGSALKAGDYLFAPAIRRLSLTRMPSQSTDLRLAYTATDADGDTDTQILELVTDRGLVADAGADQNALPEQLITLDGSAFQTVNGEISDQTPTATELAYQWTQESGPAVTLSGANTPNPSFTAPKTANDLIFALVVNDDSGLYSAPDQVLVRVVPVYAEVLGRHILSQIDITNGVLGERTTQLASGAQDQPDFSFSNNSDGDARLDSFVLPLSQASGGSGNGGRRGLAAWGAVRYNTISESGGQVDSLSGANTNLSLGMDVPLVGNMLGGLLLTRSRGVHDFKIGAVENGYRLRLSQLTPYLAFASTGINLWGGVGNGQGTLFIEGDSGATQSHEVSSTTSMANLKAQIIDGGVKLNLHLESTNSELSIDFAQLGNGGIGEDYTLQAERIRVGLELSSSFRLAGGDRLVPSLQLASIDETMTAPMEGQTSTGGSEVSVGLRYILPAPSWAISFGSRMRTLDDGRDEDGAYLLLQLDPRNDNRGLKLSLKPVWGRMDSTLEQLWQGSAGGLNSPSGARGLNSGSGVADTADEQHLNMSLGYGLELPGGRNLLHPFSILSLAPDGDRRLEAGLRWQPTPALQLSLSSTLSRASQGQGQGQGQWQRDGTELSASLKF